MIYAFDEFELDEDRFELRHRGRVVPLQAQVWKTLAHLVQHRERVVSKTELLETVWAGTAVGETAVSRAIMLARRALGDESDEPQIIKTIRSRGFRFVREVERRNEQRESVAIEQPSAIGSANECLIGRDAELAALRHRLALAERGQGSVVLVDGEPGIGKSALIAELVAHATARGLVVVLAKAWEEGGAPPFWPWVQVLRGLLDHFGAAARHDLASPGFEELRAILPELAEPPPPHGMRSLSEAEGARRRFRLFDAMARLLRALAGASAGRERTAARGGTQRRCLIVLEDLHAVDHASVQLLRFLSQELAGLSLLIVGTFRDLELAGNAALGALAAQLPPAQRLHLRALTRREGDRLLSQILGRSPAARFSQAVAELSAGNPLLIGELARRQDAFDGVLDLSGLASFPLPERIAASVRRQLAELPATAREALDAASALGREFALPLVSAVCGCTEPALLEAIAPAVRRGLVQEAPGASGRLLFSHATICNAIYSELTPTRRIELHCRVAELLESRATKPLPYYEIAHHYHLAAAGGARAKALEYARLAAEQALQMQAYEVAAMLFDRACALAELEGLDGARLHPLLMAAGDAWYRASDIERATARLDRAAERALAESDTERYVWAVLIATFVVRGTLLYDRNRQDQLRRALAWIDPGDSIAHAMLLGSCTLGMRTPQALGERFATSERAVDMARRLGDLGALEWTLNVQHYGLWGAAHPSRLLEVADELIATSTRTGNDEIKLDALMWRLSDLTELGQVSLALRDLEEYLALAERSWSPFHRYMARLAECVCSSARGDFARATELSERSLALGRRIQEPLADAFHAVRELFFALEHERAASSTSTLAADPPGNVPADYHLFWALGWARGTRTADARRLLGTYAAGGFGQLLLDAMRRPTLAALAELCVQLGEREYGRQVYELLMPNAGLHLLLHAGVYLGPVSYYLGRLAVLLDQHADASAHFQAAAQQCEAGEVRPYLVRSRFEYARLLESRTGERGEASDLIAQAHSEARRLGMAALA